MNTTYCNYAICKLCDNNCGGVCGYDHVVEAQELFHCAPHEIVSNDHCKLFYPAKLENEEGDEEEC